MLCLADRQFFGHVLWQAGAATGADLLWRVKRNLRLPRATVLADGSYLSTVYPSEKDRRHAANGVQVRVVEYRLEGVADAEPRYRLVTTILDPALAPAADLAALYHECWEIEGATSAASFQIGRTRRCPASSRPPARPPPSQQRSGRARQPTQRRVPRRRTGRADHESNDERDDDP